MEMDDDARYRALLTRDPRFDGRLFVAVTSTRIYCRPICPARTPKRANVRFYGSAAAAQEAGFRPCLRCRPELSPTLASYRGSQSTVTRALRLIEAGALDEGDIEQLAERLGIGARQLRRLFARHLGASPNAVAQTRRVLLAKQLVHDTRLPMLEVARAAGFGSLRRFNETFQQLFGRPPASLRHAGRAAEAPDGVTLRLAYAPPYDWEGMLAFLSARAIPGVEHVSADSYARSIEVDGQHGTLTVSPSRRAELTLRVRIARLSALPGILARVRRVFDLSCDPVRVCRHLSQDPRLRPLVERRPGLRVPGAWDGFELAMRAVLGQQITVQAATRLAGELVRRHGEPLQAQWLREASGLTHVFPSATRIAAADLTVLGMPGARARALSGMAAAVVREPRLLETCEGLDQAIEKLCQVPGVGPWTAHYIAMRAMCEPDAFPPADVGLLRALATPEGTRPSPAQLLLDAEPWRPWRAYAALHLWSGAPRSSATKARVLSAHGDSVRMPRSELVRADY